MSRWMLLFSLSIALLLPGLAVAKKKAPKPLVLEPIAVDLRVDGAELSKDQLKALKVAGRCVKDDALWARALENREPLTQIYEMLAGAVVCWQGAEKRAGKVAEEFSAAKSFITARTRYIEMLRSFYFALGEKFRAGADHDRLCDRLRAAVGEAAAANEAASGLIEKFNNDPARQLAAQLDADIRGTGEQVAAEYKNQKCKD